MKYWFAAKAYGYGWVPCRWQGWLVLGAYVLIMISIFFLIDAKQHSVSDTLAALLPLYVLCTTLLLVICYVTGEKPQWRWGDKK
jgi:membrane-associated HD superfamily phosphohydrolase